MFIMAGKFLELSFVCIAQNNYFNIKFVNRGTLTCQIFMYLIVVQRHVSLLVWSFMSWYYFFLAATFYSAHLNWLPSFSIPGRGMADSDCRYWRRRRTWHMRRRRCSSTISSSSHDTYDVSVCVGCDGGLASDCRSIGPYIRSILALKRH